MEKEDDGGGVWGSYMEEERPTRNVINAESRKYNPLAYPFQKTEPIFFLLNHWGEILVYS